MVECDILTFPKCRPIQTTLCGRLSNKFDYVFRDVKAVNLLFAPFTNDKDSLWEILEMVDIRSVKHHTNETKY